MGKFLVKLKSTFFTQTPLIDNDLFGAPDPLPSSKLPIRYHSEDRPHNSLPARVVNSIAPHRIKISDARHNPPSSSLEVNITDDRVTYSRSRSFDSDDYTPYSHHRHTEPTRNNSSSSSLEGHIGDDRVSRRLHSFNSYDFIPRSHSRRRNPIRHSPSPTSFSSVSTSASTSSPFPTPSTTLTSSLHTPRSDPVSPALEPFPLRSTYKDCENQRPGVPQVRSGVKEYARVLGVDDYRRSLSPSRPPGERQVSAPNTISHGTLSTSAHNSPQASPISQSSFYQRGNDNLAGQALDSNNDPNVITRLHRLNRRGVSAPITFDSPSRPPTGRDASPVDSHPRNESKKRKLKNRETSAGLVGQSSLPFPAASQRHVSASNSTLEFARLYRSSPNSLNTQRRSALSPAAQATSRDMPTLKECNICLDSHPPTEFPARPITSTCTHPIDSTCKNCLQQHLATQIASRGGAVLTCICNQPLSFEDVQRHATSADFGRYSERAALGTVERYANFVWCPRPDCGGGQIHEAGDAAPIVTCAACLQRYCYTHRVSWHASITCTQYDALTPEEQLEAIERAEVSASATLPPTSAVNRRSPQMPNSTEREERRRRRAEERAGEDFVRSSGAKACPKCGYMTEKDGGCKHMTCQKCSHEYCWICRRVWLSGHLRVDC